MAVNNMNNVTSQKYGFSPDFLKEKALNNKKFHEIYDFHRLVKVQDNAERYEHSDIGSDKHFHKKLRNPLEVGKKVLTLAERLKKKKDAPDALYKAQQKMLFFNRQEIFIVRKILQRGSSYDYWISKTDDDAIIQKRFLRQELFAFINQFV